MDKYCSIKPKTEFKPGDYIFYSPGFKDPLVGVLVLSVGEKLKVYNPLLEKEHEHSLGGNYEGTDCLLDDRVFSYRGSWSYRERLDEAKKKYNL